MKLTVVSFLLFILLRGGLGIKVVTIDSVGALANDSSPAAATKNSQIISSALQNATSGSAVLVPRYSKYYIYSVSGSGLQNVQFLVEGHLIAIDDISGWPSKGSDYLNVLYFYNCTGITISGNSLGVIDGQGYKWWVELLFNFITYTRPNLVKMESCVDVTVQNLTLRNSPRFHLDISRVKNVIVRNLKIWADVTAQKNLLKQHKAKLPPWSIPMFPFNTDGIDPSGQNILIQNITVENYDDAVAIKPGKLLDGGCTENITVENADIKLSVGMSIGSVPPNPQINCIRNIRFRNIAFSYPFKAIYIKTNSGKEGSGIIDNIVYQNISIHSPILWPVYIGPQQQYEPDGGGDGIWPPPQPLVNVTNIYLQNVTSDNGLLNAGVIRCAESNPCKNITLDKVNVSGWLSSFYFCENVEGKIINSIPKPACVKPQTLSLLTHRVMQSLRERQKL